jgi:hypothetical protein
MQTPKVDWSPEVYFVLSQYPQWQQRVIEVFSKPILAVTYYPQVIEVFDQYGLLAGRLNNCFSYESSRTSIEESDFTAWLFDGELVVFYVGSFLVINRLKLLTLVWKKLYA